MHGAKVNTLLYISITAECLTLKYIGTADLDEFQSPNY
jgi:hypothetical protein